MPLQLHALGAAVAAALLTSLSTAHLPASPRPSTAADQAFDAAYARLKAGRTYGHARTGTIHDQRRTADAEFPYTLEIPVSYDPARPTPVRIQLHGGVMMREDARSRGRGGSATLQGDEQIYIYPASWKDYPWWTDAQTDNLRAILDIVKRQYNVDENRVALAGVSDGATATYFFAMRDTTPYASFLPLNGYPLVLRNPSLDISGELFLNNLLNKPFFIVNGGRDPLYPASSMDRYVEHFKRSGLELQYLPQPEAGHDTKWWPDVKETFEQFVRSHPRNPLPDRITWETDRVDRDNRAAWLVIDALGATADDSGSMMNPRMPDLNEFTSGDIHPPGQAPILFPHRKPSGRVDLVREGNTVRATTRGVRGFTLLLSPDQFDFTQPVTVVVNGRARFSGRVEKDVRTLTRWAARDNDRTMLFGAEVRIRN